MTWRTSPRTTASACPNSQRSALGAPTAVADSPATNLAKLDQVLLHPAPLLLQPSSRRSSTPPTLGLEAASRPSPWVSLSLVYEHSEVGRSCQLHDRHDGKVTDAAPCWSAERWRDRSVRAPSGQDLPNPQDSAMPAYRVDDVHRQYDSAGDMRASVQEVEKRAERLLPNPVAT
jgi:hypothetical protein